LASVVAVLGEVVAPPLAVNDTEVPGTAAPLASTTFTANTPAEVPATDVALGAVETLMLAGVAITGPVPASPPPQPARRTRSAAALLRREAM
jgi:hypothetical protein